MMPEKSESSGKSAKDLGVSEELKTALENDQFFLVYQPEIDLNSNAFVGVEALLRWRHPQRGVLSPDAFVPDLESSGLIVAVGHWALATACAQGAEWHDKGFRFTVSVNISPLQFAWIDFVDEVEEELAASRFPAELLVLEFALSTLSGDPSTRLNELAALGVLLSIDDFEPGQSLLADVEQLPISIVKLDRNFITSLSDNPEGTELVRHLVDLTKKSKLQIVASGIEDAEQRRQLQLEEVGVGQGYLFSRPHVAADIDRFLEDFSIFTGSLFDQSPDKPSAPRSKSSNAKSAAAREGKPQTKTVDKVDIGDRESTTMHDAVRQSQRLASQLHQLIAASITVATLRNEPDILKSLARSSRTVFDADEVFVSLDSGPAAPLRGVARRGKKAVSEIPTDPQIAPYPISSEMGYETLVDSDWLVSPILERRESARGVIAIRRALAFNEEDMEVVALLAQMASSALGAVELGRSVESSESRLRVLIETAPVGIVEADSDGQVRWWNHAASSVFAWPEYDQQTVGIKSSFPEATLPELRELWSEVMRGGSVEGRDFVDVEIAGKMRVLSASAALLPTTGSETPGILTLIDDVTNHRELKAELRHAYTMEIRGQVASRIAHDFNNLITLISGYAEILSGDLSEDERARQMVNEIQSTASRASMLTTQLQAIGRTRDPELVVFNPVSVIQSNAEVLDRILGSNIDVRFELDVRAANVRVDADQFEQMILNLAINARDAMAHGGELVIAVAPVVLDRDGAESLGLVEGDYVRVTFTDNGVGMDETTREHCFDPLFTTKGPFKGTGMGLAAARRLAEESHGVIQCQSKLGEGTAFEILFPTVNDVVEETSGLAVPERPRGSATILVVDDDEELRRFMSRILERNGYRIFEADSAEVALRVVEEFDGVFDLLVSDVVMGEMSGRDLATTLQSKISGLAVLLVSGTANRTILKDLASDSSDFLAKPFKPSDLVDRVHGLLAHRS